MTDSVSASVPSIVQPDKMSCFGPPSLIDGEDAQAYDELVVRISTAIKPSDFIEEIFLRDVIDHTWDILRFRRIKAQLTSGASDRLFVFRSLSRLEAILASIEMRRNAAIREIDRRHDIFAQRLRESLKDVENTESIMIEGKTIPSTKLEAGGAA
jgi:hypothetical protein